MRDVDATCRQGKWKRGRSASKLASRPCSGMHVQSPMSFRPEGSPDLNCTKDLINKQQRIFVERQRGFDISLISFIFFFFEISSHAVSLSAAWISEDGAG